MNSTIRDMDVAVFIVDGVADFGFSAVQETFNTANSLRAELDVPPSAWNVRTVALGDSIRSGNGNTVPATPLVDLPAGFDLMIVPAVNVLEADGLLRMISAPQHRPALDLIARAKSAGVHLAAACTGTFFLAEAGVLDGSPATTSWWLGPVFRRRYPEVELDEGRTLCRGDNVTTAGAALSHLDLALSLIHSTSPALAELVSRYMMIGNRKAQIDYVIPEVIARGDPLIAGFERWVREHLGEQFRISGVAHVLGTTERSLQRATQAELGMSPQDFVNEIRLERASYLLRTTSQTVDAVAHGVGYLNAGTLRSLVRRRRGMSISELRGSRLSW